MHQRYNGDGRGGICRNIIDLVNGPDEPPEPKHMRLPPWPGVLAHTRWPGTGTIWLQAGEVYGPGDPVDMRCGCGARSEVGLDWELERIVFLVHHQPGCQALEDLLAITGAQS